MITVESEDKELTYKIFSNVVEQLARIFLEWPDTEYKSYCKIGKEMHNTTYHVALVVLTQNKIF